MKARTIITLLVAIIASPLFGQFRRVMNTKSNLDFAVTNKGIIFNNDNTAGLRWPRGSSNSYIFGGGLWFMAKKTLPLPQNAITTWSSLSGLNDSLVCITADASRRIITVCTQRNGVYQWTDTGIGWKAISLPTPKLGTPFYVSLPNGNELLGGDSGIFVRRNGSSWTTIVKKERVTSVSQHGIITTFVLGGGNTTKIYIPDSSLTNWTLTSSFTSGGRIRSISSLPGNRVVVALGISNIWFTKNAGFSWDTISIPSTQTTAVCVSAKDTSIFLSSYYSSNGLDGVLQTTDKGKTWIERNSGLVDKEATSLSTYDGKTIAVGTTNGIFTLPFDSLANGGWVNHSVGIADSVNVSLVNIDALGSLHTILYNRRILSEWNGPSLIPGLVRLCEIGYNPSFGVGWFTPGENNLQKDPADSLKKYLPYLSTNYDASSGLPLVIDDTTPEFLWPNWSPLSLSNNTKTNFRFGTTIYSVNDRLDAKNKGDVPIIISSEDIINTYTDMDTMSNTEYRSGMGYPIGLNIHETIYSWDFSVLRDIIYVRYSIVNTSNDTLKDCFLAPAFDADLGIGGGAAANDRNSVIDNTDSILVTRALKDHPEYSEFVEKPSSLNMGYQASEKESGLEYGIIGFAFVETPVVVDGRVIDVRDSSRLGGYGPNSFYKKNRLGLSSFRKWTIANDPVNGDDRYDFISQNRKDRDNGIVADLRLMLSTGPFNMYPNDTVSTTIAIGIARPSTTNRNDNLDSLIRLMAFAHSFFAKPVVHGGDSNSVTIRHFEIPSTISIKSTGFRSSLISAYPNPFTSSTLISYTLQKGDFVKIEVYDILGRKIETLRNDYFDAGTHSVSLVGDKLPNGMYTVKITSGASSEEMKVVLSK